MWVISLCPAWGHKTDNPQDMHFPHSLVGDKASQNNPNLEGFLQHMDNLTLQNKQRCVLLSLLLVGDKDRHFPHSS